MTWDPFKDEGATLIEDAPEWDPFRDEGAKRLDADPAEVIDVDPSAFKGREGYGESEKVSVADWLEKNHGVKFEDGVKDYEGKAKAFGLSGDAKGDFETLKHRESTLAARKKSSLGGVPGGAGVSGFSVDGLKSESRSAKRYAGNVARNTPAVVSKALWDAAAGTVDLGAFLVDFAMMGDPRGAPPETRRIVEKPTAFMREIADYTGKAYGVDEDFESGITGMLMQGGGTVATGLATRGYSIRGQLFTEALRDSEAERGKKFADFTDEEKDLSLFKGMVYQGIGAKLERLGLKSIAPKLFKSKAVLPKSRIARTLRAGAFESGTEGSQNVLLNMLGAAIEGDREVLTTQRLKELGMDMALGFVLGSGASVTMEAGGAAVERLDRKGEIERTIDRQMPYREDGSFNPAYKPMPLFKADGSWNLPLVDAARELEKALKEEEDLTETEGEQVEVVRERVAKAEQVYEGLLDEAGNRDMGEAAWNIRRYNAKLAAGLNPMEGATPTDWKFIDEFYSDEEVSAHVVQATGSESLVPVALQAKHGDQEAQEEFVNRTIVPADSEVLVEAEVTPEEAEAMREVEASQSEDFYRKLYPELFEVESPQEVQAEAMRDMINFVSERQLEGSTIEQVDEIRSFEQDLNDMRDQGVPEAEIERFAFNRVQAAGLDPMDPANAPSNLAVYGRNESDFRRGVWRDVSKLFRGADPMTVVEETSEGFLKRMIAEGELTYQDVAAWRDMMGDRGGETEAELIEWVSDQSKAWMVGKSSLLEREQQMPSAFRRFLAQMFETMRHLFRRAAQLRGMDRRGELDPEFKDFLERSNGLDEDFLRDRLERPAQMESASDIEIDLLEAVPLAGLPRPDMEPEYRGELEQIFEAFGKNWKSYPKTAITLDEVAGRLREEGFEVQTPKDVIDAYMAVSRGERVVNATNFTDSPSYSMGRSTVTPNPDTQIFPTKDGGLIGPATYSMKAFHGTPHKVDKFKTDNIGTGEGAQAYGYGLYFAESEAVARNYREQLGGIAKLYDGFDFDANNPAHWAAFLDEDDLNTFLKTGDVGTSDISGLTVEMAQRALEMQPAEVSTEKRGSLYTVELNVEQDELLGWDAPLSEQPEKVRKALKEFATEYKAESREEGEYWVLVDARGNRAPGENTYNSRREAIEDISEYESGSAIYGMIGSRREASETLASLGIKGIRYLDGSSRQFSDDALRGLRKAENYLSKLESQYKENPSDSLADGIEDAKQKLQSARRAVGDLSYNYVIFNDADITITEENGEPVSLATYSMGRITETPEFKNWFGDSKVVDENGEPLVVYHGGQFNETVDPVMRGTLKSRHLYFTPDISLAQSYSPEIGINPRVTSAYLSLQNPYDPQNAEHLRSKWVQDWIDFWREEEGWVDRETGKEMSDAEVLQMIEDVRLYEYDAEGSRERWNDFLGTAEDHHDGFYGFDPTDRGIIAVAFTPTQIKSATGNRGTFDPNDPRITYSMGRIDDLGGDPNQMNTARERTPEERLLAQKLREFRETDTPSKKLKDELKTLQVKAVESRKRQRLQQSAERKIAAVETRRLEQIKTLHDQGEDVTAKLEELDRIKKGLPTAVRHRLGGEVQVSRRKTRMGRQNEVNRRLVRARELAEGHEATRRKAWLRRTLKRYGTQSGPKLQNLSKEVTKDVRDRLRVALYAAHQDRPEETLERMAKPEGMDQQTFEDTARDFVGLLQPHNRDYGRIEAAYFAVQDLIREGKYSMDQFRDKRKARLDALAKTSTRQALQGNPLLNDSEIAQQEEQSGAKGTAGRWLSNAMSGYVDGFENIIRRIDGEQEGPIWRKLYADPVDGIAASQDRVNIYVADAADMLLDGMATAFPDLVTKKGEPDVSAITKRLTGWERHPGKGERTGIEMSDREGGAVVDRPLSIAEAITVKLLLRQEGSHPTFRIQHGVEDVAAFEKAVDAYIGADALAFVEHVISPFYDGAFNQLNEVHKRVEGYDLDPVKDYFPFLREIASADMEDAGNPFAPFEESGSPDGVEKGSLKTRSEMVTLPFRFQSVTSVLQNSVRTNANYIGKAGLEKKFRRLTTDPNFKRALKQRFGAKAIKQFVDAANVFTAGRMQRSGWGGWLDAARSRMITGVLAAKPKIMFTQLTSIPAGAVDMPVTEWVSGVAQIMRSPEKHFRELLATPQMKHRITQAQAQETITSLNKLQNLGLGAGWGARMEQAIKYSMILIKVGDVAGASLSAGPIYFRAKARELKAGKSESQAKQIASHEFAMAVNRSQQSPHLHSRPQTYQQSEFLRALYAFRSAPIQYQSEVNRAISEFVRISLDGNQSTAKRWEVAKQSGKAFFVYHILLPQLFYALNNALVGFWLDDDERVLDYWKGVGLTLLMGNFSAIPVAGDTIYSGAAKLTDTSHFSPTVAPIGAEQIARIPGWMDHLISGTGEQRVKAASRMANFTGLPAETITKQAQSFSELLEDDDPTEFLELMGWSEFIFGNQ